MTTQNKSKEVQLIDLPFAKTLFEGKAFSWLWLVIRLYLGYQWIESGWGKFNNPAWMQTGEALKGFWGFAITIPEAPARPMIAFDWYRSFLQFMLDSGSYVWFAKLVVIGELLVGLGLILGIFVWFTALAGGFMNWNFMMAGSASVNPVFLMLSLFLVLAWKTAGLIGLDRWLLVLVGTPWQPGTLFQKK